MLLGTASLLIIGFLVESAKMGIVKMAIFYLIAGIGGNLFGAVCSSDLTVGASPAIFGLLGGLLSLLSINWKAMESAGPMRIMLIFIIMLVFVIYLLFGIG